MLSAASNSKQNKVYFPYIVKNLDTGGFQHKVNDSAILGALPYFGVLPKVEPETRVGM